MQMFIAGEWTSGSAQMEVTNPWDQSVIDTVPQASPGDVQRALAAAQQGAAVIRGTTGYERSQWLARAAELVRQRLEPLARQISREEGKILAESRLEVARSADVLQVSAEEAKRLAGEVLPLDGSPNGAGKFGFTLRVPCGVVLAVTPFNFPLNLVCHKVGPALAGGNAVILKPASDTPLSALSLVQILLEAGVPPLALQALTGSGAALGDALCGDPRVRKISFTGSREVGERITRVAGVKRVTLELGSNSPLVVLPDANLDQVAEAAAATGFANAGQVCISTQRVIAAQAVYQPLLELMRSRVERLRAGDPFDEQTQVGPMVRERDAQRVAEWVEEAQAAGARLLCGGERQGALYQPTLLADVDPRQRVSCEELFGPAVAVTPVADVDQAITLANDTRYGLSAAVFTRDLQAALRFARAVDSGNIHINWGPQWRADAMPYGGLKDSGLGKEGPRYAIQEMTETKTVVLHGVV